MKKIYFLIVAAILASCFYACTKDKQNSTGNQAMLLGKWNLQQQKVVQYIDGIKETDTLYLAADTDYSYVQFSSNNAYVSYSYFGTHSSISPIISTNTTKGTFSISDTKFSLSGSLTSLDEHFTGTTSGPAPVVAVVSKTEQINELTKANLTLHQEVVFTETIAADTKTYKTVSDFYYAK